MGPTLVRPRLYGENVSRQEMSRIEGSLAYPSYPGRANFFALLNWQIVDVRNNTLAQLEAWPSLLGQGPS